MRVLVACEESQAVCVAFRTLGHEAYSCDVEACSGGHEEWHIRGDVLPLLNGRCSFATMDGLVHEIKGSWDMIIAFPPCTYLTSAGTRHFSLRVNSEEKVLARIQQRHKAVAFFLRFVHANCDKIVIENPVGFMNTNFRKPDQIIEPYYFGDNAKKRTCLWLKGVEKLVDTNRLPKPMPLYICQGEKCSGNAIYFSEGMKGIVGGQKERAKARSKTFTGIANAMAAQWGG